MATIPSATPTVESINREWYQDKVYSIDMLRLDIVHPVVSGNKWYKLKYNIEHAVSNGYEGVLTFGGAFSNHLIATAATAHHFGIKSIGIVRGEEHRTRLNQTLSACQQYGMELVFISRSKYKEKESEQWLEELREEYPMFMIIPEGGANEQGRIGAEEIGRFIDTKYTHVCISVGTGTTLAGISNVTQHQNILGYVPMKGGVYLNEVLKKEIKYNNWQLFDQWHFGGFGKVKQELVDFLNQFYSMNKIPLDIVYTGKMMYGVMEHINASFFPNDAKILCIHTGGLQGNISVSDKLVY